MQILWRVQNKEGKGPYDRECLGWEECTHNLQNGTPSVSEDTKLKDQLIEANILEPVTCVFDQKAFFGFISMKQLLKWFSSSELDNLKSLGFSPTQVLGEVVAESEYQVVYIPKETK